MADTLIRVENLYKIFGDNPGRAMKLVQEGLSKDEILARTNQTVGLRNINLEIKNGEVFVIMGLSGSGKSTLIRHFNRLIDPTSGSIFIDNTDLMQLDQNDLAQFRQLKISMVFQRFALMPHRNVIDNIAYGLKVQNLPREEQYERSQNWIDIVGLSGYERHFPSQLSGGQQQRVGLARALCTDAEVLLMDEAFSALDPLIRANLQGQLMDLQKRLKKTIVFITHDLDEALLVGDRIAILKDGMILQVGEAKDILLEPADEHIEAFVRNVNRARVLTVKDIMKDELVRIDPSNAGGALQQLQNKQSDIGYVVDRDSYKGVVTRDSIEKDRGGTDAVSSRLNELVIKGPTLRNSTVLQDALATTLESEFPVPVICEQGKIQGILHRKDLLDVLSVNHAR